MTRLDSEVSSAAGDGVYELKALQTAREFALTCNAVASIRSWRKARLQPGSPSNLAVEGDDVGAENRLVRTGIDAQAVAD